MHEAIITSSIMVVLIKPENRKPVGFGSGCIVRYQERLFMVSVAHVTDYEGLQVCLEMSHPPENGESPLQPIGGLCTFDLFKVGNPDQIQEVKDLFKGPQEALDITFAEIKHPLDLRQFETDFGAFKIEAGQKRYLGFENTAIPDTTETYGFFGRIKHEYDGIYLRMENSFKHSLKYHRTQGCFHLFLAPEIITDPANYEGCSGAPILDSKGRLVALACKVYVPSKIIAAFSIQECKKLLDMALAIGML